MSFRVKRRQQYLSEENYRLALDEIPLAIERFKSSPAGAYVQEDFSTASAPVQRYLRNWYRYQEDAR